VALLFHHLADMPVQTTLWATDLDANGSFWTAEWGYHIIFQRLSPFELWEANSYFPHPHSLAYADSMISAQLLYGPARMLGFGPLWALYLTLAGFCIIGAMLTDKLLRGYSFTAGERALVVAAAHFSLPMTAFLYHYQLFGMQLAPPFFLALHRLLNTWQGKDLVLVTALLCLAGGFAAYVVPMAGSVTILVFLVFSIRLLRCYGLGMVFRTLGWRSLALSAAMLVLFFVVQLLPYVTVFKSLSSQSMSETFVYSARPWSVLLDPSSNSAWYESSATDHGHWERAAFPGLPLVLLAAVGGIGFLLRVPAISLNGEQKAIVPLVPYALTIFLVSWVLSWGPFLEVSDSETKLKLPFLFVAKLIPGVENIRAPGRFAQFYGLPLGLMAVASVRWGSTWIGLSRSAMAGVLAIVVLIDQMPNFRVFPFAIDHANFWRGAKPSIEEGKPIIVLPVAGDGHYQTMSNRGRQLVSSTIHWAALVTGYGSRDTAESDELIQLDSNLRSNRGSLSDIARYARKLGIDKIVLFPDDYPPEARERIVGELERLQGAVLLRNSEGIIVHLAQ
jgi:hypothetical protein